MMSRFGSKSARTACILMFLLASFMSSAFSQSKSMCLQFFDEAAGLHTRVECLEALFSEPKWHFTFSSLPPGNGFALGGMFDSETDRKTSSGKLWSTWFRAEAIGSINQSWAAITSADIVPPLYKPDQNNSGKTCQRVGVFCTQTQLSTHFLFTRRDLRTISFYGLGPHSLPIKHTFLENDTFGTVSADFPLSDHVTAEGGVEILSVNIPVSSDALSVSKNFTEATAPGLQSQPDVVHSFAAVLTKARVLSNPRTDDSPLNHTGPLMKRHIQFTFENSAEFHWYAAHTNSHYSFKQLVATADETLALASNVRHYVKVKDISHRKVAAKFYYYLLQSACGDGHKRFTNPDAYILKVTQRCDYGQIELKSQLKSSYSDNGSVIPFYLEPTVGGADINSEVSLRGYADYRFRDRDSLFLQSNYTLPIYDPVGLLLFYDAGNVGHDISSLSFGHLRQDGGLGATFSLQHNVVAQAYMAWGAGHGPEFNYSFAKLF
jgi:hypothetical protein